MKATPLFDVAGAASIGIPPDESQAVVFSAHQLQDIADYRSALQHWFRLVRVGGHLVLVVPSAFLHDRKLALPSPWRPAQRRLYTPASLLAEIEEALTPNSYRVRGLGDDDAGYDYRLSRKLAPVGCSDIAVALERMDPPVWGLADVPEVKASAPDFDFEPVRTRVEFPRLGSREKILILKLDHLGDFIIGLSTLEKARAAFRDAHITLVVGSWNFNLAMELKLADRVLAFDVFPRNSTEEEVDVPGKTTLFQRLIIDDYDLAIDLRTDPDTRFLLKSVRAAVRAGIGARSRFPFLDIFLPIDFTRNEPETAREDEFSHHEFASAPDAVRGEFRTTWSKQNARPDSAIIWGPYRELRPGRYMFEPFVELDPALDGLLSLDVALDGEWRTFTTVPAPGPVRLRFEVETPGSKFEFRIWAIDEMPVIGFSFFGGRLIREGAASVLHQSEYTALLIELITMRMNRIGLLCERPPTP